MNAAEETPWQETLTRFLTVSRNQVSRVFVDVVHEIVIKASMDKSQSDLYHPSQYDLETTTLHQANGVPFAERKEPGAVPSEHSPLRACPWPTLRPCREQWFASMLKVESPALT